MSLKVVTNYNNFSKGRVDHDMNGRYDLPIYNTGSDIFKNFFSNFKGNAIYRPGMQLFDKFQDCRFIPFRFNNAQNYIAVLFNTKVRFLSYDSDNVLGWVLDDDDAILEVTTPYTLAQSKELDYAQNADVMALAHNMLDPYDLIRTAADAFTCTKTTFTATPFDDPTSGTKGMPARVCFYKGRKFYGALTKLITTIVGSKLADYNNFTIGTADDDAMKFTISDLTEAISWLLGGNNSLIAGSSQAIIAINGGSTSSPITPSTVEANLTNTSGADDTKPVRKDNLLFYIDNLRRRIYYFSYDLLQETFKAEDSNFVAYDITVNKISKLVYIKDKNDLIYCISDDGTLLSMNFNQTEKIIGWHEHPTDGLVKDICLMSDNNGVQSLFLLVKRGTDYFIEFIAPEVEYPLISEFYTGNKTEDTEAFWRTIAELLKGCNYLDNSVVWSGLQNVITIAFNGVDTITASGSIFSAGDVGKFITKETSTGRDFYKFEITGYTSATVVTVKKIIEPIDGYDPVAATGWYLSTDEITGLTNHEGQEVSVVGDGGYIGDFHVSSAGVLNLGRHVTVAVIGRKYEGLIKSFNLGFSMQGINTQITVKNIIRAWIRFVTSAGVEAGASLYTMEPVQDFDPSGYYNLSPLPMDGDKEVRFADEGDKDKCFYIRQSLPLPCKITSVLIEAEYGTKG